MPRGRVTERRTNVGVQKTGFAWPQELDVASAKSPSSTPLPVPFLPLGLGTHPQKTRQPWRWERSAARPARQVPRPPVNEAPKLFVGLELRTHATWAKEKPSLAVPIDPRIRLPTPYFAFGSEDDAVTCCSFIPRRSTGLDSEGGACVCLFFPAAHGALLELLKTLTRCRSLLHGAPLFLDTSVCHRRSGLGDYVASPAPYLGL